VPTIYTYKSIIYGYDLFFLAADHGAEGRSGARCRPKP
jgi:hypothetical protein